jgi:magnesium-protoporphyrin IX monomethyl ester (oxidative) cyclase
MCKIALISMPVFTLDSPTISLAQLKSATLREYGDKVSVDIFLPSHDFAVDMGAYRENGDSGKANLWGTFFDDYVLHNTGLGDWFFRRIAFPDAPDNTDEYHLRYYQGRKGDAEWRALMDKRDGLEQFLEDLIDRYELDKVDIVGFTSMFQQTVACLAMARLIKRRNPEVFTVMGGPNALPPMGQQIAEHAEHLDYVFAGPALKSFPEFVGRYLAGEREGFTAVEGVLDARNAAENGRIGPELDINVHLDLDYEFFFDSFDSKFKDSGLEPLVFFETSRGCWWGAISHCTFCGLNGDTMGYRAMEPDSAVSLFEYLFQQFGERAKHYFCVDNIMPKEFVHGVFSRVKAPEGSDIFYEVKADLSEEDVRVIAEAGVTKIQPGIESLNTSTLKLIGKGTSSFVNLALLKNCLKFEVTPSWNLLVGFPGEEQEVFKRYLLDLPKLTHLYPPIAAFPIRFDRYSPYFTKAEEYGLQLKPYDYYGLTYPYSDEVLANLAYYFSDQNFAAPYLASMAPYLGPLGKLIEQWREQWRRESGVPPELYVRREGDQAILHDSRRPMTIEHELSPLQEKVLERFEKARRRKDFDALCEEEGADPDAEFAFFEENDLLWEEGGRYMSLVLPARGAMLESSLRDLLPS